MESDALPQRKITVNQVVAWNIAYFRHEAGLTQQELAGRLGWPQNRISEAEVSWKGKRTREFDAHTLIALALALGVPLIALFLPPLDDGKDAAYLFRPPGWGEDLGMADLVGVIIYGTEDADDTEARAAYGRRLIGQVAEYLGEEWRDEVTRWRLRVEGPEALKERALRMRAESARLQADAADLGAWAEALEKTADARREL